MSARTSAEVLIRAYDSGDAEIGFIQKGRADNADVHVIADVSTWPADVVTKDWAPAEEGMHQLLTGLTYSVCGKRFTRNRGGPDQGDRMLDSFADERLCRRCHEAFGDRAAIIFEFNVEKSEFTPSNIKKRGPW